MVFNLYIGGELEGCYITSKTFSEVLNDIDDDDCFIEVLDGVPLGDFKEWR